MIRVERTGGTCAVCQTITRILRITVANNSGGGGTRDLCEYHARAFVISLPDIDETTCSCCGKRGQCWVVSVPIPFTDRSKKVFATCTTKCSKGLCESVGRLLADPMLDSIEWSDDYEPAPWMAASQDLLNQQARRRRR